MDETLASRTATFVLKSLGGSRLAHMADWRQEQLWLVILIHIHTALKYLNCAILWSLTQRRKSMLFIPLKHIPQAKESHFSWHNFSDCRLLWLCYRLSFLSFPMFFFHFVKWLKQTHRVLFKTENSFLCTTQAVVVAKKVLSKQLTNLWRHIFFLSTYFYLHTYNLCRLLKSRCIHPM